MSKQKRWTKKELEIHMKKNVKDYGSAIVCGALYKKIYGETPDIGLSGFQGDAIESLQKVLPEAGK